MSFFENAWFWTMTKKTLKISVSYLHHINLWRLKSNFSYIKHLLEGVFGCSRNYLAVVAWSLVIQFLISVLWASPLNAR